MQSAEQPVRIYTTPTCPYCNVAKRYFAENEVPYTEIDVSSDVNGLREMVSATGQYGVPVILAGSRAMVGWDSSEFEILRRM